MRRRNGLKSRRRGWTFQFYEPDHGYWRPNQRPVGSGAKMEIGIYDDDNGFQGFIGFWDEECEYVEYQTRNHIRTSGACPTTTRSTSRRKTFKPLDRESSERATELRVLADEAK